MALFENSRTFIVLLCSFHVDPINLEKREDFFASVYSRQYLGGRHTENSTDTLYPLFNGTGNHAKCSLGAGLLWRKSVFLKQFADIQKQIVTLIKKLLEKQCLLYQMHLCTSQLQHIPLSKLI